MAQSCWSLTRLARFDRLTGRFLNFKRSRTTGLWTETRQTRRELSKYVRPPVPDGNPRRRNRDANALTTAPRIPKNNWLWVVNQRQRNKSSDCVEQTRDDKCTRTGGCPWSKSTLSKLSTLFGQSGKNQVRPIESF